MTAEPSIAVGLLNLHDAFLNASLQRHAMIHQPIEAPFDVSNRGRFGRTWAAFLYVLVEAWNAEYTAPVREYLSSVADLSELEGVLAEGRQNGSIELLGEVRHYMCHRDRRTYWDEGRLGVLMQLGYNERLHTAFSKVFLSALPA